MKICIYLPASGSAVTAEVDTYVRQLASALAQDHQVTIVSTPSALGKALHSDRPDILHLHQAASLSLSRLLGLARAGQFDRVPVALTLHDYRLCCAAGDLRHPDGRGCAPRLSCRAVAAVNQWIAGPIGLVHSPSRYLLDRHLERGFFRQAQSIVLPYGYAAVPSAVKDPGVEPAFDPRNDCVVVTPRGPVNAPLAIYAAFASGSVVIASRTGGIPEIVRDGVNGILVEPGDDRAIAAAIERLRQSPQLYLRLRTEARESARLYDMAFHSSRLVESYTRLIASNRVTPFFRKAA